jgi:hypothetical protein
MLKEIDMKNPNFNRSARPILRRPAEKAPEAAAAAATNHAPLRRWSVAELIRQATPLGRPATAHTPCA